MQGKIILCAVLLPAFASGQSFDKGNKIFQTGLNLSILNITATDEKLDTTHKDKAASMVFPLQFEYAVGNKIGIEGAFKVVNYLTSPDSTDKASGFDVTVACNFHWLRREKTDLYSGLGLGFSTFMYENGKEEEGKFTGSGITYEFTLIAARFYIAEHIALGVQFNAPGYSYPNGKVSNKYGDKYDYDLKLNGSQIGASISFKW